MTPTQIGVVIFLVLSAFAFLAWYSVVAFLKWFRARLVAGSPRRLIGMMERVGIDLTTVTLGDPGFKDVMKEMRSRCRKCPQADICDRWLAGNVQGGNAFCPNKPRLTTLKRWTFYCGAGMGLDSPTG
jgi:hypothetical protein